MSMIQCKGCGKRMSNGDWQNGHDCPASAKPIKGESFADYSARCEVVRKAWLASKKGGKA